MFATPEQLAAFGRLWRMIEEAPTSMGGEIVYHADGSVTEDRWTAKLTEPTSPSNTPA